MPPAPAGAAAAPHRVGPGPLDIEIDPPAHLRRQGSSLSVSVSHHRKGAIPLIREFFSDVELRASATMRIEVP